MPGPEPSPEAFLETASGEVICMSEVASVWWRRPRLPSAAAELDEDVRTFVRSEWEHFLGGLDAFGGKLWVNSPAANRAASFKAPQLLVAQSVGLRVPRTVVTNNPEAVCQLASMGVPLIYKNIGAAPRPTATKELLPSDMERLGTLPACPAIFQERISARLDIRVTAIGTELYAAEIDSQKGSSPLDWRLDHTVPFRPHVLDSDVRARLLRLMHVLGLVYGAIDLRLTPDGEYVFFEVNPAGQYLFIELLTQMPLTEKMADFLAG